MPHHFEQVYLKGGKFQSQVCIKKNRCCKIQRRWLAKILVVQFDTLCNNNWVYILKLLKLIMFCFFLGPEDIDTLLEFTQHLKAFTNMTLSVRRALVATMVFAVVEKAGTVVMTDGEELDSWSVIINGHVEVQVDEGTKELTLGNLN